MSQNSLQLSDNELVVSSMDVSLGDKGGTLYVTNLNLMFVEENFWGKSTGEVITVPNTSIMEEGGIIQHDLSMDYNDFALRIFTTDRKSYRFIIPCAINDVLDLLNTINFNATGVLHAFKITTVTEGKLIKKKKEIIEVDEDTKAKLGNYKKIVSNCAGCGAQLIGYSGQKIKCEYCRMQTVL